MDPLGPARDGDDDDDDDDILLLLVHRCGTSGSMRACHAEDPGSIPGRDKFPGWGFLGVFPHL